MTVSQSSALPVWNDFKIAYQGYDKSLFGRIENRQGGFHVVIV
jgi:hypothetical protein